MGILDKLLRKSGPKDAPSDDGLPVLGREVDAPHAESKHSEIKPQYGARPSPAKAEPAASFEHELPSVNRRRGSNRLVNTLGMGLMVVGGLAFLYAINSGDRQAPTRKAASKQLTNMLPPLAMPEPTPPIPLETATVQPPAAAVTVPPINGDAQPIPLQNGAQGANAGGTATPSVPSWQDRKLEGGLLVGKQDAVAAGSQSHEAHPPPFSGTLVPPYTPPDIKIPGAGDDSPSERELKNVLNATVTKPVAAQLLPNRNFVIAKGTSLDCALETALDSTVPGLTTCRLTRDVYSDNGHVVMLDRGSQLVGEYRGGLKQGQPRIFVLWTRAKTPNGVIINLDSPGADALGRSGHEGWVETHFMERFGAAIMLSLVKDAFAYGRAAASKDGGSPVTIGGGGSDQLSTEILHNTVNIPPSLRINQGEHIQVMVARDLNFASVYGLALKQ